jgi:DNA-binding response OmpR family regulator
MKKILIIEDDHSYRKMLVKILKNEGYEIDEASDGSIGCDMCQKKSYDLVITDLFLPGLDGVQTTHLLKEEFSSEIKIIAISGGCSDDGLKEVLSLSKDHGADMTLKKPFNLDDLVKAVHELI